MPRAHKNSTEKVALDLSECEGPKTIGAIKRGKSNELTSKKPKINFSSRRDLIHH